MARLYRIPRHISKRFKNVSHVKMEGTSAESMAIPSLSGITQSELEDTIISNVHNRSLFSVVLRDSVTRHTQRLHVVEDNDIRVLVNQKDHRVMGVYQKWDDPEVPESYKNKDGIVVDPDSGGELMEFTIFENENGSPARTYREYSYLPEHQVLQETHEVEILESSDI